MPVLVADDEEQLLQLCERVLGKRGYAVLTARNGEDAVRTFAEHRADVGAVVIDASIRPDGAASALEQILAMRRSVGVVFTSGGDLDADQRELLLQHAGVFLRKPFPAAALVRAIEESQPREEV